MDDLQHFVDNIQIIQKLKFGRKNKNTQHHYVWNEKGTGYKTPPRKIPQLSCKARGRGHHGLGPHRHEGTLLRNFKENIRAIFHDLKLRIGLMMQQHNDPKHTRVLTKLTCSVTVGTLHIKVWPLKQGPKQDSAVAIHPVTQHKSNLSTKEA